MAPLQAATSHRMRLLLPGIAACVLLVGVALRIWAARDDLWFDEIWSLRFAQSAKSPLEIFTRIHHDNNHYLVTLWMYFIGNQEHWWVYRIPSLVTGVASIVLAAAFAKRWGSLESLVATLLTATSYVLIVYGSEARGYALAGFSALAALLALDRYLTRRSVWAGLTFSLSVVLGFLSHLTFLTFYAGALVWSVVRLGQSSPSWRKALQDLACCHAVPLGFLFTLYLADVRHIVVGGGPPYALENVIAETLSLAIGGPLVGPAMVLGALLAASAGVAGLACLRRDKSDLWIFFAAVILLMPLLLIFLMPLLLLSVQRAGYLHVRYFYISILFFLVLLSYLLGRVYRSGGAGRWMFALSLTLVVAGNAYQAFDFLRFGRGQYLSALEYMAAHSPGHVIYLESGDDFRNVPLLQYYSGFTPTDCQIHYRFQSDPPTTVPQWFILNSQFPANQLSQTMTDFSRQRLCPFARVSPMPDCRGSIGPFITERRVTSRGNNQSRPEAVVCRNGPQKGSITWGRPGRAMGLTLKRGRSAPCEVSAMTGLWVSVVLTIIAFATALMAWLFPSGGK